MKGKKAEKMPSADDTFFIDRPECFTSTVDAFLPDTAWVSLEGLLPCVKVGERVKEGQVIASGGPFDAAVHAPMPGVVERFVHCPLPDGTVGVASEIRVGGRFSYLGRKWENDSPLSLGKPEILCRTLSEKGVLNLYTAPVSLSSQIQAPGGKAHPVLVVRLYNNDESVPTDAFIARHFSREIAEGTAVLAAAFRAEGVALLYRKGGDAPDVGMFEAKIPGVKICAAAMESRLHVMPTKAEISAVLSRKGETPFSTVNFRDLFVNAATVFNSYRAVVLGLPVMESIVHVTGYPVAKPGMFTVRNGLLMGDLVEECGGFRRPWAAAVVNGMMRGTAITSLNTPVTKEVQSIRFLHWSELPSEEPGECIRCGECRSVCPNGLEPVVLLEYIMGLQSCDRAYMAQAVLCGECGLCNAVCPARLPLSQYISRLKKRYTGGGYED